MEKDFGKLSSQEFKRLLSLVNEVSNEKLEFEKVLDEEPEKLSSFINSQSQWSHYYQLSYNHFLAIFYITLGLGDKLIELASASNPQGATLSWAESNPESPLEPDDLSDDDKKIVVGLINAMMKNYQAIQLFHMSINQLLEKAIDDDDALFDAILVDRHVINTPLASARISRAEIMNDEHFFDLLTKAIKKSRPRRPKEDYDVLRFMLTALDEAAGLVNLSYEEIHSLIVDDLQLYPHETKDSFSGLKKLLQRRQKAFGT